MLRLKIAHIASIVGIFVFCVLTAIGGRILYLFMQSQSQHPKHVDDITTAVAISAVMVFVMLFISMWIRRKIATMNNISTNVQ